MYNQKLCQIQKLLRNKRLLRILFKKSFQKQIQKECRTFQWHRVLSNKSITVLFCLVLKKQEKLAFLNVISLMIRTRTLKSFRRLEKMATFSLKHLKIQSKKLDMKCGTFLILWRPGNAQIRNRKKTKEQSTMSSLQIKITSLAQT